MTTFEWKLSDGRTCRLEARYRCTMEKEVIDADGDKIEVGMKPSEAYDNELVAYVDGKAVDRSRDASFWVLIDVKGGKRIWGLKVGFANPADAERYEAWIAEVIEAGKSDEVKAYEQEQRELKIKSEVEHAQKVIRMAEAQKDIPSQAEARRRMRQYNDLMNEGGEGYVPHIYSIEEYEAAKQIIEKYTK